MKKRSLGIGAAFKMVPGGEGVRAVVTQCLGSRGPKGLGHGTKQWEGVSLLEDLAIFPRGPGLYKSVSESTGVLLGVPREQRKAAKCCSLSPFLAFSLQARWWMWSRGLSVRTSPSSRPQEKWWWPA
jgi:hypothetical protein